MDKLTELIPEFYYDLIARITPGAIFCVAIAFPFNNWQIFLSEAKDISAAIIFLFFVCSYATGFLLDAISVTVEEVIERFTCKKRGKGSNTIYEDLEILSSQKDSVPGSIASLRKVTAELTLLRVLLTSWIILGIFNKFSLHQSWLFFWFILALLLVAYLKWYRCIRKSIEHLYKIKLQVNQVS